MRQAQWVLINGIFALCLYYGLIEGHEGARNIAVFVVWFGFVLSFFSLSDKVAESLQERGRAVPACVGVTFDVAVTLLIVYSGEVLLGAAYVFSAILMQNAYLRTIKKTED